ncbi:hypothetical protein Trydic_g12563 [Trypoxylus dichotomus]
MSQWVLVRIGRSAESKRWLVARSQSVSDAANAANERLGAFHRFPKLDVLSNCAGIHRSKLYERQGDFDGDACSLLRVQ